ncbi:MAG: hypothetical protein V2B20_27560 [Pseudomonadota bacterium]
MKNGFLSCCLCLLLGACSLPYAVPEKDPAAGNQSTTRLLNIHIERWDEVRFSGLLALREQGGGLYYALLDATGVKLLEVEVASDGEYHLLHAKGALKESGLDGFLAEVLNRIYLREPATLPCVGSWFYEFCREEDADGKGWRKYGQTGSLQIWQVTAAAGPEQDTGSGVIIYRQPWLGIQIYFEPIKRVQ